MVTGVHGGWREDGSAGISVPCSALQRRNLRLHDYCLPMSATFRHAPPEDTYWWHGTALVGNELHIDNFHHFNRDALFFARALSRSWLEDDEGSGGERSGGEAPGGLTNIVITDGSNIVGWSAEHLRVVLGERRLRRAVFLPRRRALQPLKASLSNRTLVPPSRSAASQRAAAVGVASSWPPRYVCFDTAIEKLVTDPVDRGSLSWLRARAYEHCQVPAVPAVAFSALAASASSPTPPSSSASSPSSSPPPRLLLLLLRGDPTLGDKPSTARQVANSEELRRAMHGYALERGLQLHVTAFAGMSYCEQVRLVAAAKVLVGVHGQGITNGQFMGDDGLVVELFHGGARPYWRAFDNVGHQPLYLGAGRPYAAAPLAESSCTTMMQWKHQPSCKSYVNTTRLLQLLRQAG